MRKRFFKHWGFKLPLLLVIIMASLIIASGAALAITSVGVGVGTVSNFTGSYYAFAAPTVANSTAPFAPDLCQAITGSNTGLVSSSLTDGLPTSTRLQGLNSNGTLNWYNGTPALVRNDGNLSGIPTSGFFPIRPNIVPAVIGTDQVGSNPSYNMLDNNNGAGYYGFDAVHWKAHLHVTTAGIFSFSLNSDDDSWLFIDNKSGTVNQLVVDDGGIKAIGNGNSGSITLNPGDYNIDIFYADRCPVQAGFEYTSSFTIGVPSSKCGGTESFPILSATPSYFEQFGF